MGCPMSRWFCETWASVPETRATRGKPLVVARHGSRCLRSGASRLGLGLVVKSIM